VRVLRRVYGSGDSTWPYHSHFSAIDEHAGGYSVEFEVVRGGLEATKPTAMNLLTFPSTLARFISPPLGQLRGILYGTFDYPKEKFVATVQLPVVLPGMLESAQGSPEITGLEFGFADSSQPIRRAFVSVLGGERIRLTVSLSFVVGEPENLVTRMCETVLQHAPLFVRSKSAQVS
jgi:hypothetical protein